MWIELFHVAAIPRCHCCFKATSMSVNRNGLSSEAMAVMLCEPQGGWRVGLGTLLQHSFRHGHNFWTDQVGTPATAVTKMSSLLVQDHGFIIITFTSWFSLPKHSKCFLNSWSFWPQAGHTTEAHPPRHLPWACALGTWQHTENLPPFLLSLRHQHKPSTQEAPGKVGGCKKGGKAI